MLIDGAVRDVEELVGLGLPIWARWVRVQGAGKNIAGSIGESVQVGGVTIRQSDVVVLDVNGAAVVERERLEETLAASRQRAENERLKLPKLEQGELSFELDGLRAKLDSLTR
jgi:4-hydroxy-4-methyl-2-oxoglutarate aldolase